MKERVFEMLEMQDEMNKKVDIDWIKKNREWYRAIWIECGELMEHYGGWKWWKKSEKDLGQILLELVDIWHFGLSSKISEHGALESAASHIYETWENCQPTGDFYKSVETLALTALLKKKFSIEAFKSAVDTLGLTFEDIYRSYICKNVLNHFRQDKGYKEGTYIKIWNGVEDNVILYELQKSIPVHRKNFKNDLRQLLEKEYRKLRDKAKT